MAKNDPDYWRELADKTLTRAMKAEAELKRMEQERDEDTHHIAAGIKREVALKAEVSRLSLEVGRLTEALCEGDKLVAWLEREYAIGFTLYDGRRVEAWSDMARNALAGAAE